MFRYCLIMVVLSRQSKCLLFVLTGFAGLTYIKCSCYCDCDMVLGVVWAWFVRRAWFIQQMYQIPDGGGVRCRAFVGPCLVFHHSSWSLLTLRSYSSRTRPPHLLLLPRGFRHVTFA